MHSSPDVGESGRYFHAALGEIDGMFDRIGCNPNSDDGVLLLLEKSLEIGKDLQKLLGDKAALNGGAAKLEQRVARWLKVVSDSDLGSLSSSIAHLFSQFNDYFTVDNTAAVAVSAEKIKVQDRIVVASAYLQGLRCAVAAKNPKNITSKFQEFGVAVREITGMQVSSTSNRLIQETQMRWGRELERMEEPIKGVSFKDAGRDDFLGELRGFHRGLVFGLYLGDDGSTTQ
ncbi:MAG: hypothetical protein WC304_01290 [Candidatus Gracilibacteria bacterium]|jgi:hypothetical protein